MNEYKSINFARLSIVGFSLFSCYMLSFPFEGQVLYKLLSLQGIDASNYILATIIAHLLGLLSCGLIARTQASAKRIMLISMAFCIIAALPFLFEQSNLWMIGMIVSGYASGCAVAAWGYFFRAFILKDKRVKSCAIVLISSNLLMIVVNVLATNLSAFIGLGLSMLSLLIGIFLIGLLPMKGDNDQNIVQKDKSSFKINSPLVLLCIFIFIITINSGLMYQVINPAFEHLTGLTSWYWALPYIVSLAIMSRLSMKTKHSVVLYIGMAMIIGAFISFMLLGRGISDYLIVDTLLLGACGIFDLFWWSILGEILDYADNPAQLLGIGLSANVLGILCGGLLGMAINMTGAELAVIALTVVCVTLFLLPVLNQQLSKLLDSKICLTTCDNTKQSKQLNNVKQVKTLNSLTVREQEVLQLILSGKSNREIAEGLYISESTVKTHVRNIFSKYDVGSRAELISSLLKKQTNE